MPGPLKLLPCLALAAAVFVGFILPEREVGASFPMVTKNLEDPIPPLSFPDRIDALEGFVRSPDGAPVPDALICIDAGDRPAWTRSDPDGSFRITGLPAPPWEVTVVSPGHENAVMTVASPEDGTTLLTGASLPAPAELPEAPPSPLRGRVLASAPGDDLSGYELALLPTATADTFGAPFSLRRTLGTDGSFAIEAVHAGTYRVLVLPPWGRGGTWPDLTRAQGAEPGLLDHTAGGGEELLLPLLSGEVRGRILGRGRGHLAGALVTLSLEVEGEPTRHWPPVATEEDGSFRMRDLPPGTYRLQLRAGEGGEGQMVEVRSRSILTVDFDPVSGR